MPSLYIAEFDRESSENRASVCAQYGFAYQYGSVCRGGRQTCRKLVIRLKGLSLVFAVTGKSRYVYAVWCAVAACPQVYASGEPADEGIAVRQRLCAVERCQ